MFENSLRQRSRQPTSSTSPAILCGGLAGAATGAVWGRNGGRVAGGGLSRCHRKDCYGAASRLSSERGGGRRGRGGGQRGRGTAVFGAWRSRSPWGGRRRRRVTVAAALRLILLLWCYLIVYLFICLFVYLHCASRFLLLASVATNSSADGRRVGGVAAMVSMVAMVTLRWLRSRPL